MTELKPCPFCGSHVQFNYSVDLEPDGIRCMECGTILRFLRVRANKGEHFSVAMDKMADVWNRRTQQEEAYVYYDDNMLLKQE